MPPAPLPTTSNTISGTAALCSLLCYFSQPPRACVQHACSPLLPCCPSPPPRSCNFAVNGKTVDYDAQGISPGDCVFFTVSDPNKMVVASTSAPWDFGLPN